jgi:2-polyprenyl-3-methyl-5-hydroxy-6-metoxy-1,4-benzoquinol methylase
VHEPIDVHPYGYKNAQPNSSHGYLLPEVIRRMRLELGSNRATVLDIGCGNGFVANKLAELGHNVTGFDASPDGIAVARAAYPNVTFRVASVYDQNLPEMEAPADCVVSLEVIEHLLYPRKLLELAHSVLKPGGTLIVSTPYHGYLKNLALSVANGWDRHFGVDWDGGHVKFFSPTTLRSMAARVGFQDIKVSGIGRFPMLWKAMVLSARRA